MKIVVLDSELGKKQKDRIGNVAREVGAQLCFAPSEEEIPAEFADADVLYGYGFQTAAKSRDLKWICLPSAGVEPLLRPGAFANEECMLTNSAGAFGVSIAEHIIMVSLMMMRRMTVIYQKSLAGEWGEKLPQRSLKDCRITVLGTGDIGCSFAKRAKAFEPEKIIGVSRSGNCPDAAFDEVFDITHLEEVLPETDLLVMSLPGTPQTAGILSKERIALLPAGAFVVNVGRGSAIDEDALADALEKEQLAGAALDVFCKEPLASESRLWHTKNLLITPHVAGNLTVEYTLDRNVEMFCEDLLRYANGRELVRLVDRKLGY